MDGIDRRTLHVFNRLRPMYIFRALTDEQLIELTPRLERETPAANAVICAESTVPPGETTWLYIVDRGKVRLTRADDSRSQLLEPGDFFGGEVLLGEPFYSFTVTAVGTVNLLKLKKETFDELTQQHPSLRVGVWLMHETRRWFYARAWEWLSSNESVYLIMQRHVWVLWQREFAPLGAALFLVVFAFLAGAVMGWDALAWMLVIGGALIALWAWLVYLDWGNDFYLVTNQRVVYVEKVILIYDSRVHLSMGHLTTVGAQTYNLADRLMEYGDVTVLTLSKPMYLRGLAYPQMVAALIQEQITRNRQRSRESDVNLLKSAIRDRIAPPVAEPKTELPKAQPRPAPLGRQVRQFFSLQLRYEEGDTIIYRKHWWHLLLSLLLPSALLLADVGLIGLALAGMLSLPDPLTPSTLMVVALLLFIALVAWWLYEFQDWRNDLYQVTPDQIVDIYRRPLGRETRDTAALTNIQGLRSVRPGLLGRLLNFGSVIATIPGKEFTFDDVYDPLTVQEDIQRRIEAFKQRQARNEALRRREELADVLSAYYLATRDIDQNPPKPPI